MTVPPYNPNKNDQWRNIHTGIGATMSEINKTTAREDREQVREIADERDSHVDCYAEPGHAVLRPREGLDAYEMEEPAERPEECDVEEPDEAEEERHGDAVFGLDSDLQQRHVDGVD